MLPQEKFAFKYLYEGNFLGILAVNSIKEIETLMKECCLKYRKGKNIQDLREAFWGFGSLGHKSIDSHIEWALERADKVFTINWATLKF
jgi:hypothetical protein